MVSGTNGLSHTEPVCGNGPEVESHLAQSSESGVLSGGRGTARLRHWFQTRGERHLSAADQRAATVLRRGSPLVRPTGYSSADTANATPKPSVVASPTSLPPRAKASGIIVSASIVRIAPAAKERTKATVRGAASPKSP
jgi:hypothetical protein